MSKKILSVFLSFAMVFSMAVFPTVAYAEAESPLWFMSDWPVNTNTYYKYDPDWQTDYSNPLIAGTAEDYHIYYDGITLVLNGLEVETSLPSPIFKYYDIHELYIDTVKDSSLLNTSTSSSAHVFYGENASFHFDNGSSNIAKLVLKTIGGTAIYAENGSITLHDESTVLYCASFNSNGVSAGGSIQVSNGAALYSTSDGLYGLNVKGDIYVSNQSYLESNSSAMNGVYANGDITVSNNSELYAQSVGEGNGVYSGGSIELTSSALVCDANIGYAIGVDTEVSTSEIRINDSMVHATSRFSAFNKAPILNTPEGNVLSIYAGDDINNLTPIDPTNTPDYYAEEKVIIEMIDLNSPSGNGGGGGNTYRPDPTNVNSDEIKEAIETAKNNIGTLGAGLPDNVSTEKDSVGNITQAIVEATMGSNDKINKSIFDKMANAPNTSLDITLGGMNSPLTLTIPGGFDMANAPNRIYYPMNYDSPAPHESEAKEKLGVSNVESFKLGNNSDNELALPTEVTLSHKTDYANGTSVTIYRYDPTTGDYVKVGTAVVVDGVITFDTDIMGEFILTPEAITTADSAQDIIYSIGRSSASTTYTFTSSALHSKFSGVWIHGFVVPSTSYTTTQNLDGTISITLADSYVKTLKLNEEYLLHIVFEDGYGLAKFYR